MAADSVQTISIAAVHLVSLTSAGIVGVMLMLLTKSLSAAQHWASTIGTISRLEILESTEDHSYCVTVSYDYIADGQTYTGSALRFDVDGAINDFTINQLQQLYPHGAPITVYYNSARPHDSRLDPTTDDSLFFVYLLIPVVCVGIFAATQWATPLVFRVMGV